MLYVSKVLFAYLFIFRYDKHSFVSSYNTDVNNIINVNNNPFNRVKILAYFLTFRLSVCLSIERSKLTFFRIDDAKINLVQKFSDKLKLF